MSDNQDDDIVMLSAIEHYAYCPRQCGLIYLEQVYDENVATLQGSAQHARADTPVGTNEDGVRVERAAPLWSERYGLQGRADVIEFHPDGSVWPVEYKHGKAGKRLHDAVQLCAQALCLEEMLGVAITHGAIFYHGSQRCREVEMTPELRAETLRVIDGVRGMLRGGVMPPPLNDARCPGCSLEPLCQPALLCAAEACPPDAPFAPEEEDDG